MRAQLCAAGSRPASSLVGAGGVGRQPPPPRPEAECSGKVLGPWLQAQPEDVMSVLEFRGKVNRHQAGQVLLPRSGLRVRRRRGPTETGCGVPAGLAEAALGVGRGAFAENVEA